MKLFRVVSAFVLAAGLALLLARALVDEAAAPVLSRAGKGRLPVELGTTLGVAILGSILSSSYASSLPDSVDALSPEAAEAVRESLGGAVAVGEQIGGADGAQIVRLAQEAWTSGLQLALSIGAGIVLVAAAITFVFLPRRPATSPDVVDAGSVASPGDGDHPVAERELETV